MPSKRTDFSTFPKDKVTLCHALPRGPYAPSASPFPMKLETYLRMADIPYENRFDMGMSSKGKTPWMVFEGQAMADSQICIDHLNKAKNVDLNSWLSPEQRAIARAFLTLLEDNLYWAGATIRYKYYVKDPKGYDFLLNQVFKGFGKVRFYFVCKKITSQAFGQGTARHSESEVREIFEKDLQAISDYLGDKQYLMGAEPCETDASLFGFLAQVYFHFPGSELEQQVKEKFPNLGAYVLRVKERYWPDWDDCTTHGCTTEATK